MTKRTVMIRMKTACLQLAEPLWLEEDGVLNPLDEDHLDPPVGDEMPEPIEVLTEGLLVTDERRVELMYEESELSGMEGAVTTIGFDRSAPELISMMRTGPVRSAFVFEEGKRYSNVYETPYASFDLSTHTLQVENKLLSEGRLLLEYILSFHGTQSEHCKIEISVKPIEPLLDGI